MEIGDIIELQGITHKVTKSSGYFLSVGDNNRILFDNLGLDAGEIIKKIVGYEPHLKHSVKSFPEVKTLEDLEKVVNWLKDYIANLDKKEYNLIYY